jgi:hypothetical protein
LAKLDKVMKNPNPLDVLDVIEAIIQKETENMQAFLEKIKGFFKMAKKMGLVSQEDSTFLDQTFQEVNLPEPSAEPSILSNPPILEQQTSNGSTKLASAEYVNSLP